MIVDLASLQLTQTITAIGGLGTAAFGLVEAAKSAFGSINRIGLKHIQQTVADLTPGQAGASGSTAPLNALPLRNVLDTVKANWVNGMDLASQKAIAKSLIKLNLSPGNAAALAAKTNVDAALLTSVAQKMANGTALLQPESDVYARFDLIATALLDEAYQISDQTYRNGLRTLAASVAVLLALGGGWTLEGAAFWHAREMAMAFLIGLLATPLAPIAKDLSTALATAVNAMQIVKK